MSILPTSTLSHSYVDELDLSRKPKIGHQFFFFPPKTEKSLDLQRKIAPTDTFKQQNIGNCYFLAAVDTVQHHPRRATLLDLIQAAKVTTNKMTHYLFLFPTGKKAKVKASKIGQAQNGKQPVDGPKYIQLLEIIYAKIIRSERNLMREIPHPRDGKDHIFELVACGRMSAALSNMFGGITVSFPATAHPAASSSEPLIKNPNAPQEVEAFFQQISADEAYDYLLGVSTPQHHSATQPSPVLLLHQQDKTLEFPRKHAFSIRKYDPATQLITVADPRDTKNKVYELTIPEFCQVFWRILGIKLPKSPQTDIDASAEHEDAIAHFGPRI